MPNFPTSDPTLDEVISVDDSGHVQHHIDLADETNAIGALARSHFLHWPPASPHADNDEFLDADGTDPTTTGWTWANQLSVTAEVRQGRLAFEGVTASSLGFHCLTKPFPAGTDDITVVAKVQGNFQANHWGAGVLLIWGTLATPTRVEAYYARADHLTPDWNTYTDLSFTGASARSAGAATVLYPAYAPTLGFRYVHSGTTVQALLSRDARDPDDFSRVGSAVNPASARPDFYGVFVSTQTTNPGGTSVGKLPMWFDYFRVNWAT